MRLALVIAGGGLGSALRYLVGSVVASHAGSGFPWGTFAINVAGSFLIGIIATLADEPGSVGPSARVFLVVGVLGGFTTFSAFSLETVRLLEDGQVTRALVYIGGSAGLAIFAAALGVWSARASF
ncbi:MAG: fluoride efflux transporter CrcB [Anaerolinea sp.]|nr:fluoride efflux transporter CrcB [Anaerolinea sp.]